jgi:sodium transport system permease protein
VSGSRLLSTGVAELFRQEMRMFFRDRRALILSVVLPVVVMPVLMFGSYWIEKQRAKEYETAKYRYAVRGPQADMARALLAQASKLPAEKDASGGAAETPSFTEVKPKDVEKSLANDEIEFYVDAETPRARAPAEAGEKIGQADRDPENLEESALSGRDQVPTLIIYYRGDRDVSRHGAGEMRARLLRLRLERRYSLLQSRGFDFDPSKLGIVEKKDLASKEHASGVYLGRFLTLFILFFLTVGGSAVAIDSIAGEKERGTLETLLTTSLGRREIIAAKMLFVLAVALVITFLQVLNLLLYVGFRLIELPKGLSVSLSPATALALLVLYLPLVFLVSGILLLTSGISKTYKEAQLYFMPVFFLILAPAVIPLFPGLKLRSAVVLLPIGNLALGIKELLVGQADWPMLALAWLITGAAGVYVVRRLTNTLSQERLVTSSEADLADLRGGPALFPKRVLLWFGLMWVLMMFTAVNFANLEMRGQVLVNVVGLFLGGSVFLIWRYQLNVREALSLRLPHPAVWPAIILAAPASLILGQGVFHLTNLLFPAPKKLLESFSQFLVPPEYPAWELLLLIAVAPGICEEVAFRGVLLHGLRSRYRPVALALVVGGIFGFFHTALFRIPSTAFLGVLLTAATLLTGSIFPAMLWHFIVNAIGVLSTRFKMGPENLRPTHYVIASGVLVVSFLVLWVFRRRQEPRKPPGGPE